MSLPAVITFLSGSPASSRRVQALLSSLFSMKPLPLFGAMGDANVAFKDDDLDQSIPRMFRKRLCFDSTASVCNRSGVVFHILSLQQQDSLASGISSSRSSVYASTESSSDLQLLSIMDSAVFAEDDATIDYVQTILKTRSLLHDHLDSDSTRYNFSKFKFLLRRILGLEANSFDFVGIKHYNTLLTLPTCIEDNTSHNEKVTFNAVPSQNNIVGLKELVLPYCEIEDDNEVALNRSLISTLSSSGLRHPVDKRTNRRIPGLYQWHVGRHSPPVHNSSNLPIVIRPLPAAKVDFVLSNPSIIFHCPCLEHVSHEIQRHGAIPAKVGFHGGKKGQLMVLHKDFAGLDIRFCESDNLSYSFDEAQVALLAGSLDGLQNPDVLLEGDRDMGNEGDKLKSIGGDCWVEFRENLKKPNGFLRSNNIFKK